MPTAEEREGTFLSHAACLSLHVPLHLTREPSLSSLSCQWRPSALSLKACSDKTRPISEHALPTSRHTNDADYMPSSSPSPNPVHKNNERMLTFSSLRRTLTLPPHPTPAGDREDLSRISSWPHDRIRFLTKYNATQYLPPHATYRSLYATGACCV
ncbi:unnamed protein product [Ectocarpus sp. 12 AP-2014]